MAFKWEIKKYLGRGGFGSVFLARPALSYSLISSGTLPSCVAIKSASRNHSSSLMVEKTILYELRGCPEIVHCFDDEDFKSNDSDGTECYNIVLEYADGGTLTQLLQSVGGKLKEDEASWYVYMLLKGLSHVHEEGYVHCDVKPSNVLVFNIPSGQYKRAIKHNLKLADFGLAKRVGEKSGYGGTLLYKSPESIAYDMYEPPTDIWALGCIVLHMLIGRGLWSSNNSRVDDKCLKQWIANYEDKSLSLILPELKYLSVEANDFIRRCLTKNVGERWTAEQLLKHPFITEKQLLLSKIEAQLNQGQKLVRYESNSDVTSPSIKLSQNALGVC